MQAVLFIGIPGAGKSTFYGARFGDSHVRINRDMLGTKHRQSLLLRACCEGKIAFVLDNTNVSRAEREGPIAAAKAAGLAVVGYFFESRIEACLERNAARPEGSRVPEAGVRGRRNALELPSLEEGFDQLWFVRSRTAGDFDVQPWRAEAQP